MADYTVNLQIKAQSDTAGLSVLLAELGKLGVDVNALEPDLAAVSAEFDKLSQQQALIAAFRQTSAAVGDTSAQLEQARAASRDLTAQLLQAEQPAATLRQQFEQTADAGTQLQQSLTQQRARLADLAGEFGRAGIAADNLSAAQRQIEQRSAELGARLQTVKTNLEGVAATAKDQQALHQALAQLGVDAEQIATGMSKAERTALEALRSIGASANVTREQLEAALVQVFTQVKSPAALAQLKDQIAQIGAAGRLSAAEVEQLRARVAQPLPDPTLVLRGGLQQTSAAALELQQTLVGLVGLDALRRFVDGAISASRQAEAAFKGLQSVAEGTGAGIGRAYDEASKLAADGILSMAQASQALQNLLSRGYGIEQAVQTINRLTDAAAFNRQAHLQWGEAIVGATEGLRNENSQLVDNAGVTKNVAVIWKEYADRIGKSVEELTKQEKIQAEVNGVLQETTNQAGNTEKALSGMEGRFAALNKAMTDFRVNAGRSMTPAMTDLASGATTLVESGLTPLLRRVQELGVQIPATADGIKAVVTNLFDWKAMTEETAAIQDNLRAGLQDIARQYGDVTDAADGATTALGAQGEAQRSAAAEANAAAAAQKAAAENVQAALKTLGVDLAEVSSGLTKAEREGVTAFQTIAGAADTAAGVLVSSLIATLGRIETPAGLTAFRKELDALVASGRVTGEQLGILTDLQRDVGQAAQAGAVGIGEFRAQLERVKDAYQDTATAADRLRTALAELDVDLEQVRTGMSEAERTALAAFRTISSEATGTAGVISASLVAAIKDLDSVTAFQNLQQQLQALAQSGQLTGQDLQIVTGVLRELSAAGLENMQTTAQLAAALAGLRERYATLDSARTAEIDRINETTAKLQEETAARQAAGQAAVQQGEQTNRAAESTAAAVRVVAVESDNASRAITQSWEQFIPLWDQLTDAVKKTAQALIASRFNNENFANSLMNLNAAIQGEVETAERIQALIQSIETGATAGAGGMRQLSYETMQAQRELQRLARDSAFWGDKMTAAGIQARQALNNFMQEIEDATDSLEGLIARQRGELGDLRAEEEYNHQQRVEQIQEYAQIVGQNSPQVQQALSNEEQIYRQQLEALEERNRLEQEHGQQIVASAAADEVQRMADVDLSRLDNGLGNIVNKLNLIEKGARGANQGLQTLDGILEQLQSQGDRP